MLTSLVALSLIASLASVTSQSTNVQIQMMNRLAFFEAHMGSIIINNIGIVGWKDCLLHKSFAGSNLQC